MYLCLMSVLHKILRANLGQYTKLTPNTLAMTEKNSRCQTPLSQIFKYKFSFFYFRLSSICLSDLVSAFSSTVYRQKKNKQKITVNFRVKQVLFFDISGGVSHRTGRHDILIIAFFWFDTFAFFFFFVLAKHCYCIWSWNSDYTS